MFTTNLFLGFLPLLAITNATLTSQVRWGWTRSWTILLCEPLAAEQFPNFLPKILNEDAPTPTETDHFPTSLLAIPNEDAPTTPMDQFDFCEKALEFVHRKPHRSPVTYYTSFKRRAGENSEAQDLNGLYCAAEPTGIVIAKEGHKYMVYLFGMRPDDLLHTQPAQAPQLP